MLIRTQCPLGGPPEADREVYPANFDATQVTPEIFSARRMPDRMHYRMVRNAQTGCLRADPILDQDTVLALYRASEVTQVSIAQYAAEAYAHYLEKALPLLPDRRGALEIGCGHGAFLSTLLDKGFAAARGVEPSADAVAKACDRVRAGIVQGILAPGLFPPESFSLVCGFQVLDHLIDPNECLRLCRESLAPGGVMYWICHNVGAPIARLLGARCPIVDIEHVVLYDKRTIAALFARNGFEVVEVFDVRNAYPLSYWLHLAPLPVAIKRPLARLLNGASLADWRLAANFGNMGVVARRQA